MRTRNVVLLIFAFTLFGNQSVWALNMMAADTAFIRTYGGINFEEFRDIVQTPDSGFMMAGITNGYGQGSNAIYVVKTTKDGTHMWSRALGGAAVDLAYSISADASGNYYIAGTSSSGGNGGYDGYLVCLNVSGDVQWEKYYGGSDWDFIYSVKVMPDQSILLAGESYTFSDGGSDAWVLHLNSVGDTLWTKHFGDTGNDAFKDINVGATAIFLAGYVDSTDANGHDGFLVKLDYDGNEIWNQRYSNLGKDILNGSVFVPSGNIIIYGATAPFDSVKNDIWVELIDTNGVSIWQNNSGSSEDDYANKIIPIRNNDMVIVGQKDPSGLGRKCMYLARYDETGFQQGPQSLGGVNDEEGYSGVRTMEGGIAFVGYTTSYGVANKDAMLVYLRYDSTITTLDYDIVIYIEQLSPIGIDEISTDSDIFLFPNPASDKVTINSGFDKEVSTLMIYDYSGRQLHVQLDNQSKTFSTNGLSSGIYLLKITMDDGRMYSAKLTILR
ncbi:MAG: T9SS type A sorting domain-containing protein [Bacteroidetes bacterium]|nr:T9SS type A sorting domain-containing protein [Bacteroidota bacterium]MBP9790994.1 T9SS type A sorting domain-containing protein [Bacteroidia bacterium]